MTGLDVNLNTEGHSKKDLCWYANWRPRIWSKVIGDTFTHFGWQNLQGKKILEIGYRDGRMAVMFARHGAQYLGYEIENGSSTLAKETAAKMGVLASTQFQVGDFFELDETFDYVFVKSVLYHIREEEMYRKWLKKINTLLAPGGKFIALENAIGLGSNHWIRKNLLKRKYINSLLYSPHVEQMFLDTFSKIDFL